MPTVKNMNTETILLNKPPAISLVDNKPLSTDKILNAYELKTRPKLVRYYHVAAGFPTKPVWLAVTKNRHYESWTGLSYLLVEKHFPESEETWKGHGRKIKYGLRSTKKLWTGWISQHQKQGPLHIHQNVWFTGRS